MRIGIGTSIVGQQVVSAKEYLSDVGGVPTAAYSVDKVVSTYTDAVVEVRRTVSAVTVEADVAFDGDTITLDSAVTITSGSSSATTLGEFVANASYSDPDSLGSPQDAFVATWYDQAGSNDATQTTADNQPLIVNAGALVTENGKVALKFDGSNDALTSSLGLTISQPTYWFVTHNFHAAPSIFDGIIGNLTGDSEHRIILNSSLEYTLQAGGALAYNSYQTSQSLITYKIDATDERFYLNGAEQTPTSGSGIGTDGLQSIVLGGINQTSGITPIKFQEIILYNADKSALRTAIEDNINGRFNIYP